MNRPSTSRRYRLLALCLVAFAFQRGELISQEDEVYADWADSPQTGGYEAQNGQWPVYSTSESVSDYDTVFPEAISTGNDYYDPSTAYQDSHQPYTAFDPAPQPPSVQQPSGKEAQNYVVFTPPPDSSPSQSMQHPLSEQGKAVSHPFNSEGSTVSSQLSSLADFIAQTPPPGETAPNAAPLTAPQSISRAFESAQIQPLPAPTTPVAQKAEAAPAAPEAAEPESQEPASEVQSPAAPRPPTIITPASPGPAGPQSPSDASQKHLKEISINFNNVSMIEYIRFISRISNKNFIFDEENLQFNVTIVSEEPTTVENLMAALLQELKIRDLSLLEQGNNIIIHRNPRVRSPARIYADGTTPEATRESELVTRVFRLNTLDPVKASEIIRPLLSEDALVEVLRDTNNLIITDLVTTVNKVAQLIDTLDAPNSGVTIGQYVVRNAFVDSLVDLGTKILQPIAQGNPFVLVPHPVSNSIFIVSNSFIVEKALAILQNLDLNEGKTKILSLEGLQPSYEDAGRGPGQPALEEVPEGPRQAIFRMAPRVMAKDMVPEDRGRKVTHLEEKPLEDMDRKEPTHPQAHPKAFHWAELEWKDTPSRRNSRVPKVIVLLLEGSEPKEGAAPFSKRGGNSPQAASAQAPAGRESFLLGISRGQCSSFTNCATAKETRSRSPSGKSQTACN